LNDKIWILIVGAFDSAWDTAFLGERPSRNQLLGVGVGAVGLIIVALGHSAIALILVLILVLVLGAAL